MEWNEWMFRALNYPSVLAVHDIVKPISITHNWWGERGLSTMPRDPTGLIHSCSVARCQCVPLPGRDFM